MVSKIKSTRRIPQIATLTLAEDIVNDEQARETCKEHENHLQRAKKLREVYRKDASLNTTSEEAFSSMDMQKILMLAHLPGIKTALFTRRIIMINQSIAPLGTFKNNRISPEVTCGTKLFKVEKMKTSPVLLSNFFESPPIGTPRT